MLTLYLMRHAKAEEHDPRRYADDSKRPLSKAGIEQITQAAKGLGQMGVRMDRIFSSPYLRARQTAEIAAKQLKFSEKIIFTDALRPNGDYSSFLELLEECPDRGNILWVSHQPAVGHFVSELLGHPDAPVDFQTASVCCMNILGRPPVSAKLQWFKTADALKNFCYNKS